VLAGESCRQVSDSGNGRNGEEPAAGDGDDLWPVESGSLWRTMPIPRGGGIVEYVIVDDEHRVILTRIVSF
jgi:hypothetical protein